MAFTSAAETFWIEDFALATMSLTTWGGPAGAACWARAVPMTDRAKNAAIKPTNILFFISTVSFSF